MSDDFGTINVGRGERAREIEVLREHYRRHREALTKLIADAPTEHLATEYRRLIGEVDNSLVKLDELEGRRTGATPLPPPPPPPAAAASRGAGVPPASRPDVPRTSTQAGMRPLETSPTNDYEEAEHDSRSRLMLIIAAAVIALGIIGYLIWRASSDRSTPATGTVVEQTTDSTSTAAPATIAEDNPVTTTTASPAPAETSAIRVTPRSHDYGIIRKGTRATRQFEIRNTSDEPATVQVARSTCRCLYYEYVELIPPKGKESVTVTIDGARAKAGNLRETVRVTGKKDPSLATSFDVIATIR